MRVHVHMRIRARVCARPHVQTRVQTHVQTCVSKPNPCPNHVHVHSLTKCPRHGHKQLTVTANVAVELEAEMRFDSIALSCDYACKQVLYTSKQHAHTHIYAYPNLNARTRTHAHTQACTHARMCTRIFTRSRKRVSVCPQMCESACMPWAWAKSECIRDQQAVFVTRRSQTTPTHFFYALEGVYLCATNMCTCMW